MIAFLAVRKPLKDEKVFMAHKWEQDFKSSPPLHCFPPPKKSERSLKEWRKQLTFGRKRTAAVSCVH